MHCTTKNRSKLTYFANDESVKKQYAYKFITKGVYMYEATRPVEFMMDKIFT